MNNKNQALNRLKRVLLQDKVHSYEGFLRVIKGDLYTLMSCYMTVKEPIEIEFDVDEDGDCNFCIRVSASNLKSPKTMI